MGQSSPNSLYGAASFIGLPANEKGCDNSDDYKYPLQGRIPTWRLVLVVLIVGSSAVTANSWGNRGWVLLLAGLGYAGGTLFGLAPWGKTNSDGQHYCGDKGWFHFSKIVAQKPLTLDNYCATVIAIGRSPMANVLPKDKQIAAISALAEGSSIRSIERMAGVHRDTVMRLGVRVGQGCARLMDAKMHDLPCRYLQLDELWGFIGKKERHLLVNDNPEYGDVWTFCAIDAETKLVPAYRVGKRDIRTATAFVGDLAGRLSNRVQISAQSLRSLEVANQKRRRPGRPRLPKGEAKNRTLPAVRFAASDMKAIETVAKAKSQTVSEWVRSTLLAAVGA
jgi:hypothetical protein